jgi:hypothetical protein
VAAPDGSVEVDDGEIVPDIEESLLDLIATVAASRLLHLRSHPSETIRG